MTDATELMGNLGWPIDKGQLKFIAATFIKEMDMKKTFKENMLRDEWLSLFQKHWQHCLSQRKPEYLVVAHAKCLTKEILNEFFTMLGNLLDTLGINNLLAWFFNLDEAGLSLDPKKKCTFYRDSKNAQMTLPTEWKTMYTMLFCGNAAGSHMPS